MCKQVIELCFKASRQQTNNSLWKRQSLITVWISMRPIHFGILFTVLCCSLSGKEIPNLCSFLNSRANISALRDSSNFPLNSNHLTSISTFHSANPFDGFSHDTSQDVQISGYSKPCIFAYQTYEYSGASIACNTLMISNNKGPVRFENNFSMAEGGAIYTRKTCTLTKNQDLTFKTNTTNVTAAITTAPAGLGGAIKSEFPQYS
ncbi:hypothetical protein [Candidatus Chlamydia corallus]|uniref:hypothetical protein n=1 Tax=Candidatus Chlamydia corallus TaxID=2038470 RepID=UPI000C2FE382|nr:hypothetical protein [Candidatus Chlamydia corallus]